MKIAFLLPALAAVLVLRVPAVRADPPPEAGKTYEVREVRDVGYVEGDDSFRHKLDLFVPRGKKDFPVVVFFHGGVWMFGDKSVGGLYSAVGHCLAENGVGAVFANYRLSPMVKHPEHVKDAARAVAWTYKNIGKYGGDSHKLFVGGHSAGAHLAALLATDEQYLKAEGLSLKNIRGVLAVSGIYRIPDKIEFTVGPTDDSPGGKVEFSFNPLDLVFGKDAKVREDASPLTHVRAGLPPFLLVYADQDLPLLPEMADEFAKALKDKKDDVQVLKVKDRNHGAVIYRATGADDPVAKAMLDFVAKHADK
jgi:acetyl esterase/lipase